jgi:hypothetical protein
MRITSGGILFAAHDLDRFFSCTHATWLDFFDAVFAPLR